jgi:hypothetical protein
MGWLDGHLRAWRGSGLASCGIVRSSHPRPAGTPSCIPATLAGPPHLFQNKKNSRAPRARPAGRAACPPSWTARGPVRPRAPAPGRPATRPGPAAGAGTRRRPAAGWCSRRRSSRCRCGVVCVGMHVCEERAGKVVLARGGRGHADTRWGRARGSRDPLGSPFRCALGVVRSHVRRLAHTGPELGVRVTAHGASVCAHQSWRAPTTLACPADVRSLSPRPCILPDAASPVFGHTYPVAGSLRQAPIQEDWSACLGLVLRRGEGFVVDPPMMEEE